MNINIFMRNFISVVNEEMVYILLKPRISSLLQIYFRTHTLKKFNHWRKDNRKGKHYIFTGSNLVKKVMHFCGFKPTIKRIKRWAYKKDKAYALNDTLKGIRKDRLFFSFHK